MGKLTHRSNWGFWESESIDSPVGTFNVHLKRRWNSIVNDSKEEINAFTHQPILHCKTEELMDAIVYIEKVINNDDSGEK